MKRISLSAMLLALWCLTPHAQADSAYDSYLGENGSDFLDSRDREVLGDLERTSQRRSLPALSGAPGEIVFAYGSGHHSIVCAVLELCDISLEPGERIRNAQIGDSARWSVDSAVSGSPQGPVQHLVVKPLDSGLRTSLVVTTDRRAYHLRLKSSASEFMPAVRFTYPGQSLSVLQGESALQGYAALPDPGGYSAQAPQEDLSAQTLYSGGDSAFDISGDAEVMPKRVFFDGQRTVVEMPDDMERLPALLLSGNGTENGLINYRIRGRSFVIDGRISGATLILKENDETFRSEISAAS